MLSFACLDPKQPFIYLTKQFKNIILNSECITDPELYGKVMGLPDHPIVEK